MKPTCGRPTQADCRQVGLSRRRKVCQLMWPPTQHREIIIFSIGSRETSLGFDPISQALHNWPLVDHGQACRATCTHFLGQLCVRGSTWNYRSGQEKKEEEEEKEVDGQKEAAQVYCRHQCRQTATTIAYDNSALIQQQSKRSR